MDDKFQSDRPIDVLPATVSRSLRLAIVSSAIVFPVIFCILLKPTAAQAAWMTFTHIMQIEGHGGKGRPFEISSADLATLPPQQQAELLLEAAVNQSSGAAEQISGHANSWRGRLKTTPKLSSLLDRALNSSDLDVRASAIETELAESNLAKNSRSLNSVIARVNNEPSARPWGLWMLGALGNRGVDPGRALSTLANYARDPNENTRYWAVEGLSVLGSDETIQPLLAILRNDPAPSVRDRAAGALAQSGMLTRTQRLTSVPKLIDDTEDSSLDARARELAYRALRDITGKNIENDPGAWRAWWTENAAH